jgi:DNA repair ATPase RecN
MSEKTTLEVAGFRFTGGKIFLVLSALSATIGSLYGGFEVYKDYQDMKAQIQSYIAPDLSGIDQTLLVLEERMVSLEQLTESNGDSLAFVTNSVTRDVDSAMQDVQAVDTRVRAIDQSTNEATQSVLNAIRAQDRETQLLLSELEDEVEERLDELQEAVTEQIQQTLANPLAGN